MDHAVGRPRGQRDARTSSSSVTKSLRPGATPSAPGPAPAKSAGQLSDRQGVGAAHREIRAGAMQFGQGAAEGAAMLHAGALDPHAVEEGHHGGRSAHQRADAPSPLRSRTGRGQFSPREARWSMSSMKKGRSAAATRFS